MTNASTTRFLQATSPGEGATGSTTMQASGGGRAESSSGELLMVEGYVFLWLLLMGWLLLLWRKQARLHERIDGLEKAIGAAEASRAGREKGAAP